MEREGNILNIVELDANLEQNGNLILYINDYIKTLQNYHQKTIYFIDNMINLINSFQNEINTFQNIPLNISTKIFKKIHTLKNSICDYEINNMNFFEETKDLYKKMKENQEDINNKPQQNNLNFKAKNEELRRDLAAKDIILARLKKEYLFLNNKEISNSLSDENTESEKNKKIILLKKKLLEKEKEIEDLNEKLKKVIKEDNQKNSILKRFGIEIFCGVKLEKIPKDKIIEDYEDKIEKYKNEIQDLKDIIDIKNEENSFLEKNLFFKEKEGLEKKIKLLEEENENLKKKYQEYIINPNKGSINNISINNMYNINKDFKNKK